MGSIPPDGAAATAAAGVTPTPIAARASTQAPTLEDAIALAARLHTGQIDKAGEEYIGHPRRVMETVSRTAGPAGVDPLAAQFAAILHDVVEDTEVTPADLTAAGYPSVVVDAVDALSRRPDESMRDYLARVAADPVAVVVKHADMQDNSDPVRLARLGAEKSQLLAERYAGRRTLLDDLVAGRRAPPEAGDGAGAGADADADDGFDGPGKGDAAGAIP
ncbi:putative GTP diphosphokinase [Frankia sp. AiPs1]|uniref:HD domain-containing protein n=1 Tax=Frankia sp. AiPa1 TaxID=573492 RepID=UPI00202B07DE|nr:HD domain-containing protein [Frankia sp. AiPa1]MCL9759499.1 HD domain-containing protein [Frankia sp. AiPa1]